MARSVGSVSVSVVPDATGFVEKLKAELEAGTKEAGAAIGQNIGAAMRDAITPYLDEIKLKIDQLGSKDVTVRVKVDDNGSIARTEAELAAVDSAAGSGGNGFNLFGSKIANIGLLAVAAADIAIPAILAIGAAAAGALAGVGVLALGFDGVGAALQAHGQKAPGGGTGGASSALGLQSAQIAATQATQSAQDQLTQATEAQTKAETDLHLARVQAVQDLQDLDNKLKDNTISAAQAEINLRIARQTLAVTLNAPGATQAQYSNQVAQARLNVAAAQQKVNELTLEGTRLTAADATAHKNGVNNNPNVLAAQQTLTDANRKLAEAQANIGITAQKNAIALQQAALSMVSAAAGANAFGQAMSKLNPIQQQFVEFLLTLKPLLDQIKLAASGFLPGLEAGLKGAESSFGPILAIVSNVAKAMGQVFQQIFAQLNTPAGQKFLTFLATELPKQILFLGNLFIDFGKILSGIFEAAGPLITAFDQAFLGALNSIGQAANGGGLKTFFASLIPLIKPTFAALSAISGAIGSVMKALAPVLVPVLGLITQIADAIGTLVSGPVGQLLVRTLIDVVNAVSPLIPLFLQILQTILPPLITLIDTLVKSGIGPLVQAIATALAPVLPPLGKALDALVKALAPFLVQLIQGLIPVLGPLSKLLIDILTDLTPLFPAFGQLLQALTPLIKPFASLVSSLLQLVDKLLPLFLPLLQPLIKIIPLIVDVLKPLAVVFADIATAISDVVDALTGLSKSDNAISGLIDLATGKTITLTPGSTTTFPGNPFNHKAVGGKVTAGVPFLGELGSPEMFIPKVDGTIINAVQTGKYLNSDGGGKPNYFSVYGQSDPVATAHQVANRFAARGV